MGETTPQITGLGRKWYDPKAFYDREGTKIVYMSPNEGDKFFRTPYNNISGLSPDSIRGEFIPPVITGPSGSAGDLITAISINENSTPIHIFSADETVTWSKSGADASKFTLNTSTGELVFASAPNYEVPTDADGNNIYQVVITATDAAGNASSQTVNVTVSDIDESPILNSSTPADNATTVALDSNIVLNFNKAVDAESGNIYIKKTSDNSTVQTIDVTSGAVSGSGSATITINPPTDLPGEVELYVLIDDTAFDAADSSSYAGISSTTALSFTTAAAIDTDLLLHIDPSDSSSYSGSGSTVTDLSSYSNNGTIESNVGFDSTEGGGSFEFDSSSNSEIQFTPITINHTAATVELWLKNTTTASNTVFAIANSANNSWSSRVMSFHIPWGGTVYFDGGAGNDGNANRISKTDPTDITTKWYHWTFVLSTTEQKIYLNGVEWHSKGSGNSDGVGTAGNAAHTTINHGDDFRGHVGIVKVWKKALSASDAIANFNLDKVQYGYALAPTPTLSSSTPADGATDFAANSNIILNFNTAVDAESGNIYIKKVSDNSTVETISVTGGQVSGSGTTTITINPSSDLTPGTDYYINIDATAFDNVDGVSYAGISDSTTLNFTAVTPPTINTTGLIMHMDPGDTNSYSGSGTTWYDLTSNNNDWTLNGTVSHGNDSVATSTKVFSMTNVYVNDNNNIEMDNDISTAMHGTSDSDYTVMVASRYNTPNSGQRNATFGNTDYSPQFFLGHWNNTTGVLYQSAWIDSTSGYGSIGINDWAIYTTTRDQSEDAADLWVNDTKHIDGSSNGSSGPKKLRAGGASLTHGDSTCCIGVILVYDRVLTDTEITNNYNALKARYGLS